MGIENFLLATVRETQLLHDKILTTPSAKVTKEMLDDINNFIDYCGFLLRGGVIKKSFYNKIVGEIKSIDFEDFAKQRAEAKIYNHSTLHK